MDEKLKELWNTNKLFFFLLLPLAILWFFKDLVFSILAGSARKTSEEARKQDEQLQSQSNQAATDAAKAQAAADAAAKRIADRKEGDVSEDWNKKGN